MTIRTVLSVLDVDHGKEDLKNAIGFCEHHGAHLTALVICMAAPPPIGSYQAVSAAWVDERQREIDQLGEKAAEIKQILEKTGVSYDIQDVYTEFARADIDIAERALYADIVLVGPHAARDDELRRRVIDGALFQSPAPILIHPSKAVGGTPKSILIAWDSSDEAARAVRQSLDFLKTSEAVHVTLVDPVASRGANGEEPGADIAAFLARHGVNVNVDRIASGGRRVDEALKQHAVDVAADMIVMGAYNHPRLQQRLFGGVTRFMLEGSEIPLFLSH